MSECRSIEEYLRGPDGNAEKGLRPTLERVASDARQEGVSRIEIECRAVPAGTTSSRQEWTSSFAESDPIEQVMLAIRRRLEESPSEGFSGRLRLNFRAKGQSQDHLGSFSRNMRPAVSAEAGTVGGVPLSGDVGAVQAVYLGMVKPLSDQHIRLIDAVSNLVDKSANLVKAQHPPAAAGGKGQIVGDLLRGAMNMAGAASSGDQKGGPVGPQAAGSGAPAPPGPPGMPDAARRADPPGPGGERPPEPAQRQLPAPQPEVDEAAVRAWLAQNQSAALNIGQEMLDGFGMQVVPK